MAKDDCPHCGSSKYLHDAAAILDQDVIHLRCQVCFQEWVE